MPIPRRRLALLAGPLLLVACSGGDEQPGGVTADQARQLNEAAEMLDDNSVDLNAVANDQDPS
jgi:hypothetical protein